MIKKIQQKLQSKKIWVTGHNGMVGSAIIRRLAKENCETLTVGRNSLDLRRQDEVERWIKNNTPDIIICAAAKVGGIHANAAMPAEFLYDNLMVEANIIHAAHHIGVDKLILLGSSCIYPRDASQPISEDQLLKGPLEKTNEWYAIAKIAGIKLCQAYRQQYNSDFISIMPTNLYGPGDNFDPKFSHVPAALLNRFHEAKVHKKKSVKVWGTGTAMREFLHVDDLADACLFLLQNYSESDPINVGTGIDISIADFSIMISKVVDYNGAIQFDTSKPDGTPKKLLDTTKLKNLGWAPQIPLEEGLSRYYKWYLDNSNHVRR